MNHQEAVDSLASERYLLGEMDDAERDAYEDHYFSCAICAEDVRGAAILRDGVRAKLLSSRAPQRQAWRPSVIIPWAAAATFALAAGYTSLQNRVAGPSAIGAVALAPVTLRSATRGQEATVAPGPGGLVTLAIDLGGQRFERGIEYEVKRADQTTVASGQASAPSSGAPLLLAMPSSLLGTGHYVLVVKNPGNPSLTPEEYRFSVESR